jgi:phosphodiesterase/alkaline phosphatase D-like protein
MAVSLIVYRDATASISMGQTRGLYPGQTLPLSCKSGVASLIQLSGLNANTRYYYRLRIRGAEGIE